MNYAQARVLVVEDTIFVRNLVHDVLRDAGIIEIDEAEDGEAALEMLRSVPYDLVITDWQMPSLGGLGLINAIRRWPERANTQVLVLSGSVDEARGAGAAEVVGKPFTASQLVDKVMQLVEAA